MTRKHHQAPGQHTRERALYIAGARVYAEAFHGAFVRPLVARGLFRRAVESLTLDEALKSLVLYPDDFGPRSPGAFGSAARDPAFIYWTQRDRRPRALLFCVADLLRGEAARLAHIERKEQAREEAGRLNREADALSQSRARCRAAVAGTLSQAASVYAQPAHACRAILRTVRRHGAARTRALIEQKPDFFGNLRVVPHRRAMGLVVFHSLDEAQACVDGASSPTASMPPRRPMPVA